MLGLDNQDFAFFSDSADYSLGLWRNLLHYFVISDL